MRNRMLFVAGLAALSIGVAACGGSSSGGSNAGGSTPSSSSSAATGSAIKVGMICSCTGPFGASGIESAGKTVQAWADSVNANGGVNGHKIELTVADDTGNPGTSVTKAQSLIDAHVAVILDLTPLDAAWQKQVNAANIPVVGGNFSSPAFFTDPNWYPSGQTNDSIVYANIAVAKQAGAKKFGQLYCAEAPQCQESVAPHKKVAQQLGVPDVYNASIAATAPNYTAQCLAAKKAGVDALFIGHGSNVVARVITDCARQGYTPNIIEEGTGFTMAVAEAAGTKGKVLLPFPILPFFVDKPAVQTMNDALDKYAPGVRQNKAGFSEYSAQAWTGGLLIEAGAKAATGDTIDAAAMKKGLDSIQGETLGGWTPEPLNFEAGKPHSVKCWYVGKVEGGTPSLVSDQPVCQNS